MSTTYPLGLNESAYNGVIQFGILSESLFPQFHNLSMTEAVGSILNLTNINLTKIYEPSLIRAGRAGTDPSTILLALNIVLQDVPHTNGDKGLVHGFIVIFVISVVCVLLRIYQRWFYMPGGLQPEDWAMVAAMFPVVGLNVVFTLLATKGYGNLSIHIWDLSYDDILKCLRYLFASELIYPFALFAVRHSLHLFYRRLTGSRVALRTTVNVLIVTNICCLIFSVMTIIWQCEDRLNWWIAPLTAVCPKRSLLFLLGGIFIIVTDIATVLLAIPLVYNIKMPLRKKIVVCFIFSLGFVSCAASLNRVIRVRQFFQIQNRLGDVTYESAHVTSGIWSLLEVDLAVMVGCVPALKSFAITFLDRMRASRRRIRGDADSIGSFGRWKWMDKLFSWADKLIASSLRSGYGDTTLVGTAAFEKSAKNAKSSKAGEGDATVLNEIPA